MKRAFVFVIMGVLTGLGIGVFARSPRTHTFQGKNTRAGDSATIDKLHQADIEATLRQDPSALTLLWDANGVNLGFPGPPVVGIKAMGEAYAKFRAEHPDFKVLKYAPVMTEVQIADGWAIEVGYTEATYKMSARDEPVSIPRTQGMRVLKRQSDGSWKFAVVGLK